MIIDGYTAEHLIDRAIGGTTLDESVKALQDVFVDHDQAEKGEPMRLIDADALLEGRQDHEMISTHLIWNAPTIDAVPVVRCQDCQFYDTTYPHGTIFFNHFFCKTYRIFIPPHHFCALGTRRSKDDA